MRVAVVTDSTAYIPEELREKHHIHMIPLSVIFNDTSYQEEIDLSAEDFYEKVREYGIPTTSQPPVGAFVDLFSQLARNHDAVISIHLSSRISGTYQAAVSAEEMVDGIKVYAYDSELSAMPQGFYAIKAAEMSQDGKTADEIIAQLDHMKSKIRAYFMVDDLTNLQKGGRLSHAQAVLGGLLKIKPVLHFVDKVIVPFEKIRTRKKAIQRIVDMLEADAKQGNVERVVFIHGNDERSAIELRDQFAEKYPDIETVISYFGPVIGTHLGEGALGISWYTK